MYENTLLRLVCFFLHNQRERENESNNVKCRILAKIPNMRVEVCSGGSQQFFQKISPSYAQPNHRVTFSSLLFLPLPLPPFSFTSI